MKTLLVTLGDRPAVVVDLPEGKGDVWVYRDVKDRIFASRTPPKEIGIGHFVIRRVRDNGDVVFNKAEPVKKKKPKGKVAYGAVAWEDEVA